MTMLAPIVIIFVCNTLIIMDVLRSSQYRAHLAHENILNKEWQKRRGKNSLEMEITGQMSTILEEENNKNNNNKDRWQIKQNGNEVSVFYSKVNDQVEITEASSAMDSKRHSVRSSIAFGRQRRAPSKKSARSDSIKITRMLLLMSLS